MTARAALIATFVAGALLFTALWVRALRRLPSPRELSPTWFEIAVGVVTDFFDTLGIGSFAVTTSLYRLRRAVPDRVLPGTLNVGHCLPTFAQAILAVTFIEVDALTLVSMIGASVVGAWFGAGVVARLPLRAVRIGLAFALLVAACLMVAQEGRWLPSGGEALGLRGTSLVIAIVANAILGALMTLGVGLYAPCMILVSVLGMNVKGAFPIMMGSCALLMPVGSLRFFRPGDDGRTPAYAPRAAIGLALGGVPAVLVAGLVVKSLPLDALRWLVVAVVVVTAATMLRAARASSPSSS